MPYVFSDEPAGSTDGKWVRYDSEGAMVKGWYENENGRYYYDPVTGAMAKGKVEIEEKLILFDTVTGIMVNDRQEYMTPRNEMYFSGWKENNGQRYWYENGVRQGTLFDSKCVMYDGIARGREIYDPASKGWYWLDVDNEGAMARNKEVFVPYVFADEEPGSSNGKWVRYDDNGKMIYGVYYENGNTWFYQDVTGAMLHDGFAYVSGFPRYFAAVTGLMSDVGLDTPRNTTSTKWTIMPR